MINRYLIDHCVDFVSKKSRKYGYKAGKKIVEPKVIEVIEKFYKDQFEEHSLNLINKLIIGVG